MMISVRKDVLASTGGYQVPWENSSLTRQFYFTPGSALAATPETQLWQIAATARDPALLRIYAERYPDGSHIPDVLAMIQDTETKVAGLPEGSGASRSLPGADKMSEEALWELARRTRSRSLVEFYLNRKQLRPVRGGGADISQRPAPAGFRRGAAGSRLPASRDTSAQTKTANIPASRSANWPRTLTAPSTLAGAPEHGEPRHGALHRPARPGHVRCRAQGGSDPVLSRGRRAREPARTGQPGVDHRNRRRRAEGSQGGRRTLRASIGWRQPGRAPSISRSRSCREPASPAIQPVLSRC